MASHVHHAGSVQVYSSRIDCYVNATFSVIDEILLISNTYVIPT